MIVIRPYQRRAVNDVLRWWHAGSRRVCLVAPTASGKTTMAGELVRRAQVAGVRVVAFAHRRELVVQMCERFALMTGEETGAIGPGFTPAPWAPIQVATVQTLAARDLRPEAGLVVVDECHHLYGGEWTEVLDAYPNARVVGCTATPERADGVALGDTFEQMVVAAQYSELLAAGHIAPCRVYAPTEDIGTGELAQCPVAAYQKYGEGRLAFCFVSYVEQAEDVARAFNAAGVAAAVIHGETPTPARTGLLDGFRAGAIRVLVNVYTMTEGVDVPEASCCILARGVGHASTYLQMVGRVLRAAPGKIDSVLIDLSGASRKHGLPTEDRVYSLTGEAMAVKRERSLTVCPACGYTFEGGPRVCARCGHEQPTKIVSPRIYDFELRELYAGDATPLDAKLRECQRLMALARKNKWSMAWVATEYKKLFKTAPPLAWLDAAGVRAELDRWYALGRAKGYKAKFAHARYHATFDRWP